MSLEINTNDQSIDTRSLSNSRGTFQRSIAGLLTTLMLFSGSVLGTQEVHAAELEDTPSYSQEYDDINPDMVVEIPEIYQYEVYSACGKQPGEEITVRDLNNIQDTFLTVPIEDDSSLEWLNYVRGVEYLTMFIKTSDTSVLQQIKELKGIKNLSISTFDTLELTAKDFSFLKNSDGITGLSLYGFIPEPGIIESLTHLKKLQLQTDGNYKIDFTKLTFLDVLDFPTAGPYDVAVDLTSDEYYTLVKNGVSITFDEPEELAIYEKVTDELDDIVASLNVDQNSTDQEKLDAILIYVLDNLTYDPEISEALKNETEHDALTKSFYQGGQLYGALEKDTAICGNYTALTNALAERLGINTYYLKSATHAWSLVEVEGEQYYVDSTWLDGQSTYKLTTSYKTDAAGNLTETIFEYAPVTASELLKEGSTEDLEWYMEDPTSYPSSENSKESHTVINLPSFYKITPQEEKQITENEPLETIEPVKETSEEQPIQLDEEEFEVKIGNKTWIVGGAAIIGILGAFGGAIAAKNYKDKKERERRRQQAYNDYQFDSFSSSSGFYDVPTSTSSRKGRR